MRPFPPRLRSWPVARASSLPSGRGSHRRGRKRAGPGRRQREHDARAGWPHPAALGLATGDQGRARLAATPSARALAAGFADRTLRTSYRETDHRKEHGRALRGDGEDVAIGRKEQDELALESHHRAIAAQERGFFDDIIPVDSVVRDGIPRRDTPLEKLPTATGVHRTSGKGTLTSALRRCGNRQPVFTPYFLSR